MNKHKNHYMIISGTLILVGMITGMLGKETGKGYFLIVAAVIASIPIARKAFLALRMKAFSIELLVTIAVIAALFIGEYVEASIVAFLFLFGAFLEVRTLEKTRSSLKYLINMTPQKATVIRDKRQVEVSVEEVIKGDRVILRSGGQVPVDGKVITGKALLNEAAITGESIPVTKKTGDTLYSGTMVDSGYLEMLAEKVGDDTTFAKIIELVEEAQESKTKTEKFLDRFAQLYTPGVVLLAIIVYAITRNLHLAITLLVIACPGALVIGAPVSNVAGIGNGARNGVLVKGGEVMEILSKVDILVFDKTGTLTKGKPEVTDIKTFGEISENEILRLAAEAESGSEHHLGKAIVKEAFTRRLVWNQVPNTIEIIKGKGISAKVEGFTVVIGNRSMMLESSIEMTTGVIQYAVARENLGNTAIFVAVNGGIKAVISVADQIREDAVTSLQELRADGIRQVVMLTGDNQATAKIVATQLGIEEYHAELLPEDKVEMIKALQRKGHMVAMAGDGINDAPAIGTANIGVAMGEGGTDVAMETADIVLMADRLSQLSHAYALSKATIRNMKANTYFAVGVAFILLMGVLLDYVHLASGMFIHEASVLIVILHAMRLVRFNKTNRKVPIVSSKESHAKHA
ncbi:cation-translocating P-type ATPase [Cytobacillus oceanisediminis]|uniref:heavy metal translocating P-type ATPase n=1 Tax=Cytobacillus oceanisediminis TaxID=665099 RepID=UPI001CCF3D5F|nr:cation-translocating P-type ATPase [Cytobacillus oceanisediminis]MBZ9535069.1 cation-translocating P-type ATPase [Cytobacillus oceanisediminis]